MQAYRELPVDQLFREQWVRVSVAETELPGYKGERILCALCGEGVNFGRFSQIGDERLCLSCSKPELRYWEPVD